METNGHTQRSINKFDPDDEIATAVIEFDFRPFYHFRYIRCKLVQLGFRKSSLQEVLY